MLGGQQENHTAKIVIWMSVTISLGPRKTTKIRDLYGLSRNLSDAYWILGSNTAFKKHEAYSLLFYLQKK
jgi:hypothetical protein